MILKQPQLQLPSSVTVSDLSQPVKLQKSFDRGFKSLINHKESSDIILVTTSSPNSPIHCHKATLHARWPNMRHSFADKKSGPNSRVEIANVYNTRIPEFKIDHENPDDEAAKNLHNLMLFGLAQQLPHLVYLCDKKAFEHNPTKLKTLPCVSTLQSDMVSLVNNQNFSDVSFALSLEQRQYSVGTNHKRASLTILRKYFHMQVKRPNLGK